MKIIAILSFLFIVPLANAQDCPDTCHLYIPNTLTPDCDGFDCGLLRIESECTFIEFKFELFNRWGELIFESESIAEEYRISDETDGTYLWRLKGIYCNGTPIDESGYLNILR